jgi:colanic acid/amylovoran biosynthesis glycosyltransferase
MRICFIVGEFPALSETFLLNQMTGLMDAGCEIRIAAARRSLDTVMHEDVVRHGLLHHASYREPPRLAWLIRFFRFIFLFTVNVIRTPGPVLRSLNVLSLPRGTRGLDHFFTTLAFLPARDSDVIVCHGGDNGILGLRMKQTGAVTGKLVTVFHAADLADMARAMMSERLQELFARGDLFLAVSRHAREKLIELGCPERKIVVHHMGVDVRQFDVSARRRFGSSRLRILSVARLVEKKGIAHALEAMALLKDVFFEYIIIGEGPLRSELEDRAHRLGLLKHVRFMGARDSGTIRRFLKDTDIFLAPNLTTVGGRREAVPVVLMEAMASGVPVVTTAAGSVRELVQDGRTGFLVPEADPQALAAKIRSLRAAPGHVETATRAARAIIEEQFNIAVLNQVLFKLLSDLVYQKDMADER